MPATGRVSIGLLPWADHYFVLNDGPARSVFLTVRDRAYVAGEHALEDTPIDTTGTVSIDLPARSAVWRRSIKR